MTFTGLLNRRVDLEHRATDEADTHGNPTTATTGWHRNVPARRELLSTLERAQLGDLSAEVYLYLLDADEGGLALTRLDRIHDGPDVYEIRGAPDVVEGATGPHHIETVAERISG